MISHYINNPIFKASPFLGLTLIPDSLGFTVVAATNHFLNLYQINETDVLGKSFFEVFEYYNTDESNTVLTKLFDLFSKAIENKEPKKFEGFFLKSKKDNHYPFETKFVDIEITPVFNEVDLPISIIVSFKDIEKQTTFNGLSGNTSGYDSGITQNSLIAFFLAKPDGTILEVNKAGCDLFGYSVEELRQVGRKGVLDHSEISLHEKLKERKETGKARAELVGIRKSGEKFPIEISSHLFLDMNGEERTSTFIIDITERKKIDNTLLKSEYYLQEAQKMAKMGSWNFDLKAEKLTWTEGLHHVFGTDRETFLETYGSFINLVIEEDKAFVLETSRHSQLTGEPFNIEYRIITPAGENRIIEEFGHSEKNADGDIIRLFGTAQDITERKQAEQVLKLSEKKYKTLFEDNPLPMFIWDFETLNIIDCNEEALIKYGYTREEFLQLNIRDIRPKEDVSLLEKSTANEVVYGQIHKEAWRHLKKNGELMLVEITGHLMDYNGRKVSLVLVNDITEKKKLEVLLSKSNRLAAIGSWEIDVVKGTVYWSDITKEIREVDLDFVPDLKTGISYFKEGKSKETISQRVKECIEKGTAWDEELQFFTHKGNLKWIRTIGEAEIINDKCIKIYGSFQDINERKKAEISLAESENRFRTILEAEPECVKLLDSSGKVVMINSAGLAMIEADNESQILGTNVLDIVLPEHRVAFSNLTKRVFKGDSGKLVFEIKGFKGTRRWMETHAVPLKNDQGAIVSLLGITRDITQRIDYENSLKQLNETLEQNVQKLAISNKELEQFAYVASHDLQEPLRMITSFLDLLEKKYGNTIDDKGKQYIHFAVDGAVRMRQIILDLLEFSKIGRLETEMGEVNINELVNSVLLLNRSQIKESNATIEVEKLPIINSHKTPLIQVFQNLIGNALKYRHSETAPAIKIKCSDISGYWMFSVADNGIGINKDSYEKIFDIFQRLHNKDEYSGSGIGLAIVKKIIDNLDGKIWLESEEGKGSIFYFTIPK